MSLRLRSYILPYGKPEILPGETFAGVKPLTGKHEIELPRGASVQHLQISPAHRHLETGQPLPVLWCAIDPVLGVVPYAIHVYEDDQDIKLNPRNVAFAGTLVYPDKAYHVFLAVKPVGE